MPSAPYGSWRSPITAALIASSSIGVSQPAIDGPDVYWLESRPTEGGRSVIVRRTPDGNTHDVIPAPINARTRVHEYGGGDYLVHNGSVYFANFADQRLYVARHGADPIPLTHATIDEAASDSASPQSERRSEGEVTPEPSMPRGTAPAPSPHRYADFDLDVPRNRLLCVREDHSSGGEPENCIAAIDVDTGDETVLVRGHDFFAYPRLSPDGAHLAWVAWDHPNMPWDGTHLYLARLDAAGAPTAPVEIAGGLDESVLQPAWSPDGRLAFISDRTGRWNLYLRRDGAIHPLVTHWTATRIPPPTHPEALEGPASSSTKLSLSRSTGRGPGEGATPEAEFAKPLWQLGAASYAFIDSDTIICSYCVRGSWRLARLHIPTGVLTDIDTPYTDIGALRAAAGRALFIAGSPSQRPALISLGLASANVAHPELAERRGSPSPQTGMGPGGGVANALTTLKSTSDTTIDSHYLSLPETIEFPTTLDGAPTTAFAFYYPPHNADYQDESPQPSRPAGGRISPSPPTGGEGSPAEKPPLLVISHGGPTAATSAVLSPRIQYWTSRGIAVLDVNYGGSTGYGTDYRRRLNRRWGIVDVDDCVNAARYLVERGDVDPARLAITGGSAGGYTTLCALTMRDIFSAGASYYGVAELEALARDTHKFESRYTDNLIGPYPGGAEPGAGADGAEREALLRPYRDRSPINHVEGISCPVIFFQGLEDQIVPPNQAEMMVDALRRKGIPVEYITYEGEQHGFRRAENIQRSLEAEIAFYGRIFGFLPR